MDGLKVINSGDFLKSLDVQGKQSKSDSGPEFSQVLSDAVQSVNELQKSSDKAMQNFSTGKTDNIADVMIVTEKADLALRLMVQVRNKIIDAYQEMMKMQV